MSTIGSRIRNRREELGLSQDELGKRLGYKSRSSINKIELDQRNLTQSKIKAIADALDTTPAYIMGWEDQPISTIPIPPGFDPMPDMDTVPLVGRIACGTPITAEQNTEGMVCVPSSWRATFTLICRGSSMEPRIHDGDLVAIRSQEIVETGEIAAVRIGEEATLKHVYLHDNFIELRPENPAFESIILTKEEMNTVVIEGKAVGLCRDI